MFNMKRCVLTWTSLAILSIVFFPITTSASPKEVILFYESAHVVEESKIILQSEGKGLRKGIFVIPGNADPDSLLTKPLSNSRIKIVDQSWRQVTRQDDAKIAELRNQLLKLRAEKKNLQASLKSIETQIQFWQLQTKTKIKTIADANNVSVAIGKNIKKFFLDKLNTEAELEKIDKNIRTIQEEIEQTAGKKETAWEITTIFSDSSAAETEILYSYVLSGCGWSPRYRLEARPEESRILFSWEAELWQSSGKDWNHVDISLATLMPVKAITPNDLPPWIISPRTDRLPRVRKKGQREQYAVEDATELQTAHEALNLAPRETRQSTFSLWQLGKKSVAAGVKQRITLIDESWPADFKHFVRPALGHNVFLRASVQFSEGKDIPSGLATFMLDGAMLGKRDFSLVGENSTLYFGIDPMIKATETLLSKQAGEKTFLLDKQTFSWERRIDVQNSRKNNASVIIEEPNPQTRDERIKISAKYIPEPSERTTSTLTWTLDVPAGKVKSIMSSVKLEAPKDMNIDLGWRR